jgi:hypothetical protein
VIAIVFFAAVVGIVFKIVFSIPFLIFAVILLAVYMLR